MRRYHNFLYICHGTFDETEGLKQALSLARINEKPLKVLVVSPEFPEEFPDYRGKYEEALLAQAKASIKSSMEAIKMEEGSIDITVESISDQRPSIRIIQYVLQHGHDFVIKDASPRDAKGGFKALDMNLLRQCPSPLWLCRPIKHSRQHIQVAVAIDPKSEGPAAEALSIRMLQLSRSLADNCNGELDVVSCWDYPYERYLRDSVWIKVSEDEVVRTVNESKNSHRAALENIVEASSIGGSFRVHHLRGNPAELIPSFTVDKKIDILVMGTVARAGIPGFMIGNTAENIAQKITCSLLALKPQGFVSPINAY
tara:strand:+ start:288 stop:1226 length:939 start_codon:yes stop_codon:yes gene_type:complete